MTREPPYNVIYRSDRLLSIETCEFTSNANAPSGYASPDDTLTCFNNIDMPGYCASQGEYNVNTITLIGQARINLHPYSDHE